ncbi:MAG: metallophosphoesterase [Bacteroidetes bacterium]|nr:metallophosphoesterase [Bacteroidota bacterium]
MKIQYCSDLHLEFRENMEFIKLNPLKIEGDILLLAGDIVPFAVMERADAFFDFVSANFKLAYWLPGNHEYYGSDAALKSGIMNEKIRDNIFLVNNLTAYHDELKLIFSTLWSKISTNNQWVVQQSLSDFHVVKFNGKKFTPDQYNQLNNDCISFIKEEISKPHEGKTIVVTHHVPTFLHYPEKYKGDALNEAFAVELYNVIESSNIDSWIYGHHHNNTPEFSIGNTRMLTNQLGYVRFGENRLFNSGKVINHLEI